MHFYYLDKAGCTGSDLANPEQPIFVLGGISVRDEGWNATQESLSTIMKSILGGEILQNFELHADQLLSPNGDGPFSGHERDRRNNLAKAILGLLADRNHDVHLCAIDKAKLSSCTCYVAMPYDTRTPYHLAYDYLITYINWFVKNQLGRSARGMLIIDAKEQFHADIEHITQVRRFEGPAAHRVKWIVEFSSLSTRRRTRWSSSRILSCFVRRNFWKSTMDIAATTPKMQRDFTQSVTH